MRQPVTIDEKQLESVASKAEAKAKPAPQQGKLTGKPASKVISSTSREWKVPKLADNFDLEAAKSKAFREASYYMNGILNYDDLHVEMEWEEENPKGHVKDVNTGKLVSTYEGTDLLKVYSQNNKERGIIVDGRV